MGPSVRILGLRGLTLAVRRAQGIGLRGTLCQSKAPSRGAFQFLSQRTRTLLTTSHAKGPTSVRPTPSPPPPSHKFPANPLPSQPPLLIQTIPQHFSSIVSLHGDRTAIISRSQGEAGRLTYRALDEKSNVLARGLQERGVKKGERVAVSLGNCWEFAVVTYALFKLGAILVCPSILAYLRRGN